MPILTRRLAVMDLMYMRGMGSVRYSPALLRKSGESAALLLTSFIMDQACPPSMGPIVPCSAPQHIEAPAPLIHGIRNHCGSMK